MLHPRLPLVLATCVALGFAPARAQSARTPVPGAAGPAEPPAGAVLHGRVVDAASGLPLSDVEVRAIGAPHAARTDAGGRFEILGVSAGTVALAAFRLGYEPAKRQIVVPGPGVETPAAGPAGDRGEIVLALQPLEFRHDPIVVTAARVQRRESPVPYAYLSRRDLSDRYTTQDLPMLLSELPSAVYYSENGNGLGYTYLTLRGFDQRRISVLVNGVPQNDPEDQGVY